MSLFFRVFMLLALGGFLASCSAVQPYLSKPVPPDVEMSELVREATERMLDDSPQLAHYNPLIAASFVNIDALMESSTLGRLLSELFASSMAREGFLVREVKMRDSLFIEENVGELILSREIQRLTSVHSARAVLLGTYAIGRTHVYVSVRVVRASDSVVLGVTDLRLPLNANVMSLLGSGRR